MKQLKYWSIFLGVATYLLLNIVIDALLLVEYSYTFGYSLTALIVDAISTVIILPFLFLKLFSPRENTFVDSILGGSIIILVCKDFGFATLLSLDFNDRMNILLTLKMAIAIAPALLICLILLVIMIYFMIIFFYENFPSINLIKIAIINAFYCGDYTLLDNGENV